MKIRIKATVQLDKEGTFVSVSGVKYRFYAINEHKHALANLVGREVVLAGYNVKLTTKQLLHCNVIANNKIRTVISSDTLPALHNSRNPSGIGHYYGLGESIGTIAASYTKNMKAIKTSSSTAQRAELLNKLAFARREVAKRCPQLLQDMKPVCFLDRIPLFGMDERVVVKACAKARIYKIGEGKHYYQRLSKIDAKDWHLHSLSPAADDEVWTCTMSSFYRLSTDTYWAGIRVIYFLWRDLEAAGLTRADVKKR